MPSAKRRAARIARGVCANCAAAPPAEGRVNCEQCLEAKRLAAAEQRDTDNDRGLCQACHKRKQAPGRGRRCRKCADKYLPAQLERTRAKRAAK